MEKADMGSRARARNKESLVEALKAVFIARGYHGATLAELANATGLSKASLYHHFPGGKTEMAAALIRHAIAECHESAYGRLGSSKPAAERLLDFLTGMERYAESGQLQCLLAVFGQQPLPDDALNTIIRDQFTDWEQRLALVFEDFGHKPKRSLREARKLMSQMYGALLLAKLHNAPEIFSKSIRRAAKELVE